MLTVQARANPGELGLHDVMLHLWMSVCGDSLVAMRALSALAGTIAIVLVYLVAREVLVSDAADNGESAAGQRNLAAAIATLFFAVNLITIKYSREARMYSLALMLSLLQVWFFLRALRKAGTADYVGLAATTGLTFIATFTAGLILVPEGLFLLLISAQRAGSWPRLMRIGAAVATGLLLVIPSLLL